MKFFLIFIIISHSIYAMTEFYQSLGLIECEGCESNENFNRPKLINYLEDNTKVSCRLKNNNGCEFYFCESSNTLIDGYPQKVSFVFPKELSKIDNIRIHLQGYSFGRLGNGEDYDSEPVKVFQSNKMDESVCLKPNQLMVLPFSTGKCVHYDNYLNTSEKFDKFIDQIEKLLYIENRPNISMSAHSGGGRTISKIIDSAEYSQGSTSAHTRIKEIALFDAIYSSTRKNNYVEWFKKSKNVRLQMYAVAPSGIGSNMNGSQGASPFNYSRSIFNELSSSTINSGSVIIEGVNTYHKKDYDDRLQFYYQAKQSSYHHWHLNRDLWSLSQ